MKAKEIINQWNSMSDEQKGYLSPIIITDTDQLLLTIVLYKLLRYNLSKLPFLLYA